VKSQMTTASALSRQDDGFWRCLLSEAKRACRSEAAMSAYDPLQTSVSPCESRAFYCWEGGGEPKRRNLARRRAC
jgi:hypothetical protein